MELDTGSGLASGNINSKSFLVWEFVGYGAASGAFTGGTFGATAGGYYLLNGSRGAVSAARTVDGLEFMVEAADGEGVFSGLVSGGIIGTEAGVLGGGLFGLTAFGFYMIYITSPPYQPTPVPPGVWSNPNGGAAP